MTHIDYRLPLLHPSNVAAARELGLVLNKGGTRYVKSRRRTAPAHDMCIDWHSDTILSHEEATRRLR